MVWDYDVVCDALFAMPKYPRPPHVHAAMLAMLSAVIACATEDSCPCFLIIADYMQATSIAHKVRGTLVMMPDQRDTMPP